MVPSTTLLGAAGLCRSMPWSLTASPRIFYSQLAQVSNLFKHTTSMTGRSMEKYRLISNHSHALLKQKATFRWLLF